MTGLLVVLGAAVGAPLRYAVASTLDGRLHDRLHAGTLAVNVVGSFLLGLFSALSLSDSGAALLMTGFCGGFTTYSAFAVQTHDLGPRVGAAYAGATVVLALAACALGFWVGQA
ncbi:fluoride efflux transporter FluC [Nocardioides sp.]|uniref:fluoride efflux transporter FluC n=1 Tax=Nocardioides sp. TaxID=35761 RepID=UPI003784F7EA